MAKKARTHEDLVMDVIAAVKVQEIDTFNYRVCLVEDPPQTQTAGGIHIPDQAQKKECTGRVVSIGNGILGDEAYQYMDLCLNDHVAFTKYGGIAYELRLPDGTPVSVVFVHVSDLYFRWKE